MGQTSPLNYGVRAPAYTKFSVPPYNMHAYRMRNSNQILHDQTILQGNFIGVDHARCLGQNIW